MVRTKVLVAGDAAARPDGLVAMLEEAGFLVEEVPAGGDLAAAAATAAPDAVLLCVGKPTGTHLAKVKQLRETVQQWSSCPWSRWPRAAARCWRT